MRGLEVEGQAQLARLPRQVLGAVFIPAGVTLCRGQSASARESGHDVERFVNDLGPVLFGNRLKPIPGEVAIG